MSKSKILRDLDRMSKRFSKAHPVASTALAFGSAGAAAAAMAGLVRDLGTAIEDRKKREKLEKDDIDPDTIVLRIPKSRLSSKAAEDGSCADPEICRAQEGAHDRVARRQSLVSGEMPVGSYATSGLQRDIHGQFTDCGEKSASTGPATRALQIVGGIGGAAVGFSLVRKLHEKMEQNRLKRQIAAAQQEYLDLIGGSTKHASVASVLLCDDPLYGGGTEKKAGIVKHIFNLPDSGKNIAATALASYIMMALGAGYVTNRVLRQKFDEEEDEEPKPKVKRILFKASEAAEPFEVDPGAALATIGVMADCMLDSHDPMSKAAADYSFIDKISATPEGRQWLLDAYAKSLGLPRDITGRELPGLGMMDKLTHAGTLIGISRHPDRHAAGIKGHVMGLVRSDPEAWFSLLARKRNSDLVGHIATDALSKGLSRGEFGAFSSLPQVERSMSMPSKVAQSLSDIPAMLSRSAIISDKRNIDLDRKLDKIMDSLHVRRTKKKNSGSKSETKVEAGDDESEEFVLDNGEQIARILNGMKADGLVA